MTIWLWVLVLILDPEEFNEWARTKDNMEITLTGFTQQWECQTAKEAMEREAPMYFKPHKYVCVYNQMFSWKGPLTE